MEGRAADYRETWVRFPPLRFFECLVCDASGEATALSRQRDGFDPRTDRRVFGADLAVVVHAPA
jgi:hypothetical protein